MGNLYYGWKTKIMHLNFYVPVFILNIYSSTLQEWWNVICFFSFYQDIYTEVGSN